MPKRRAKPNTLYWLIRMLTPEQLEQLHVISRLYLLKHHQGRETKVWLLIDYYSKLEVWSRDAEVVAWGEHLDVLKARALKWLISALVKIDSSPKGELLMLIGGLESLLADEDYAAIFEVIGLAKDIATERERFPQLLQILQIEMAAVREAPDERDMASRCKAIVAQMQAASARIEEQSTFQALVASCVVPFQEEFKKSTTKNVALLQQLSDSLAPIAPSSCLSVRARYEYHVLWLFHSRFSEDVAAALKHSLAIVSLHDQYPWLREGRLGQYFSDIHATISFAANQGDRDLALSLLRRLREAYDLGYGNRILAVSWFVKALLYIATNFNEEKLGVEAVHVFKENKEALASKLSGWDRAHIFFKAARACMVQRDHKTALDHLDQLRDIQIQTLKGLAVHGRAMECLCMHALAKDDDLIENRATNAVKFIQRQQEDHPVPLHLCRQLSKMPSRDADPKGYTEHLILLQKSIQRLLRENQIASSPFYFDYVQELELLIGSTKDHQ